MLTVCDEHDLASINRIPLLMGLLTGKHSGGVNLPPEDIRSEFLKGEHTETVIRQVDQLRDVLTQDGRTPVQGALGWIWARHERTIPIPGFKTVKQVEENIAAMEFGPLSVDQMRAVDEILEREPH
jgi:aryl-alcohol dehydrogenase-like predicted oxidoreductase